MGKDKFNTCKTTTDTNLRWFQLRIIHILTTNSLPLKIKLTKCNLCMFVNMM